MNDDDDLMMNELVQRTQQKRVPTFKFVLVLTTQKMIT